jgi:hypothetical protein
MLRERQMTKRPGDAACGDTAARMLLERYWERLLRRIKGSAESIEHTNDSETPRIAKAHRDARGVAPARVRRHADRASLAELKRFPRSGSTTSAIRHPEYDEMSPRSPRTKSASECFT